MPPQAWERGSISIANRFTALVEVRAPDGFRAANAAFVWAGPAASVRNTASLAQLDSKTLARRS